MKRKCVSVLVMGYALLAPLAVGQDKNVSQPPRLLPGGGVATPAGKVGFFPNTSGGIDALDLASGKVLWSSNDANRPLLATEDRLFAQRQNSIFSLDAQDGKRVFEAKPIGLPGWASVEVAYGRSYQGSVRLEGTALLVSWEARAFYAGGARPTPEIEKAARMDATGVARVDVTAGKITALEPDQIAAGKFFPLPAAKVNPKVGMLMLTILDGSAKNAKNPFEKRRTLQAVNDGKEIVWQRDIAAPIFLLPRP